MVKVPTHQQIVVEERENTTNHKEVDWIGWSVTEGIKVSLWRHST
jgi:hypothetical protein